MSGCSCLLALWSESRGGGRRESQDRETKPRLSEVRGVRTCTVWDKPRVSEVRRVRMCTVWDKPRVSEVRGVRTCTVWDKPRVSEVRRVRMCTVWDKEIFECDAVTAWSQVLGQLCTNVLTGLWIAPAELCPVTSSILTILILIHELITQHLRMHTWYIHTHTLYVWLAVGISSLPFLFTIVCWWWTSSLLYDAHMSSPLFQQLWGTCELPREPGGPRKTVSFLSVCTVYRKCKVKGHGYVMGCVQRCRVHILLWLHMCTRLLLWNISREALHELVQWQLKVVQTVMHACTSNLAHFVTKFRLSEQPRLTNGTIDW